MTDKNTYAITKRLYHLLRNHSDQIEFEKLKGATGFYYEDGNIEIDYRRDIISSLIHECLHHWHRDWSEKKVLSEERHIIRALTSKQIKNIVKVLSETVCS